MERPSSQWLRICVKKVRRAELTYFTLGREEEKKMLWLEGGREKRERGARIWMIKCC